jgi:adenosylcobinamide kinase/adenosylcobinamide-phosphate guanylyltransferase
LGKLVLITGGARSGKSSLGEEFARQTGKKVLYIATSIPFDEEMVSRVKKHRERRPLEWETLEAYKELDIAISSKLDNIDAVLLDCITIMVSNIMLEVDMSWEEISVPEIDKVEANIMNEIIKLINVSKQSSIPFFLITNELGMGVVPPTKLGRAMRDIGGRVNQMLAREAEEVFLCVSGIPVRIK